MKLRDLENHAQAYQEYGHFAVHGWEAVKHEVEERRRQADKRREHHKKTAATLEKQKQKRADAEGVDEARKMDDTVGDEGGYRYPDPEGDDYKEELKKEARKTRDTKYGHLPLRWFEWLLAIMVCCSTALWIEGGPPGHVSKWLFDLQPIPGRPLPPPVQPAKLSPNEQRQERHHLLREMKIGHMARPTEPGSTSSQCRPVRKPGDEALPEPEQMGRLVIDYRKTNWATCREAPTTQDAEALLAFLTACLWKSVLDLLWGFNHVILTQRASRLMAVMSSMGLLNPTVLTFGIHNGPTGLQTIVNGVYEEERLCQPPKVLVFVDDTTGGTGKADDPQIPNPLDENNAYAEAAFEEHLDLIMLILVKAMEVGFKFKLQKANLAQLVSKALGYICGRGRRSVDPAKTEQIVRCPRPIQLGDPDSFLGGTSFLRPHLATVYSSVTRPLRDITKVRLEKQGLTGAAGRSILGKLPEAKDLIKDGKRVVSLVPVAEWADKERSDDFKMRSGTLPWSFAHEKSFREIKRLVVGAIDLFVPDLEGARDGTNPLLVLPDACGFAAGAGLMQFGTQPSEEDMVSYLQGGVLEKYAQIAVHKAPNASQVTKHDKRVLAKAFRLGEKDRKRRGTSTRDGTGPPTDQLLPRRVEAALNQPTLEQREGGSDNPKRTYVALFTEEQGLPVIYSGTNRSGERTLPVGHAAGSDGEERGRKVLQVTVGAVLATSDLNMYTSTFDAAENEEGVVGVVSAKTVTKLPLGEPGKGDGSIGQLKWSSATTARGAEGYVYLATEAWAFLGRLEAVETSDGRQLILRPLALWSRSFSGAQLNWTTWEKELFAIKESLYAWASTVTGMHCIILPDHLNNIIINAPDPVRQAEKILRWFVDICVRVVARWALTPGIVNYVGDFTSRNPEDRDAVRPKELEDGQQAESRTLKQILEQVGVVQTTWDEVVAKLPIAQPRWTPKVEQKNQTLALTPARTPSGRRVARALWLPSVGLELTPTQELPVVLAPQVLVHTVMRVDPLFEHDGLSRWAKPLDDDDRKSAVSLRRLRAHYCDSALHILRLANQMKVDALLCQGEASIPAIVIMNEAARNLAYSLRRVSPEEREVMETGYLNLRFVLLHAPCAHPPFQGAKDLAKAFPEVEDTNLCGHLQVHALRLRGDAYSDDFERFMFWLRGHVMVQTLERSEEPAIWDSWRRDWVPELKDTNWTRSPLLYVEEGNALQGALKAYGVPSVALDATTFTNTTGRRRLIQALKAGEHDAFYIREPTESGWQLDALFQDLKTAGPRLVCWVSDNPIAAKTSQEAWLETEYYREADGQLPTMVHYRDSYFHQLGETAHTLKDREMKYPIEAAFVQLLGAYLVETKPSAWAGYELPRAVVKAPVVQAAMTVGKRNRFGFVTNVRELYSLSRLCEGEAHAPREVRPMNERTEKFYQEYMTRLRRWSLRTGRDLNMAEIGGRNLGKGEKQIFRAIEWPEELVGPQASLVARVRAGEINYVHFWLDHEQTEANEQRLELVQNVAETLIELKGGFTLDRPWEAWRNRETPYWWARGQLPAAVSLLQYDLCRYQGTGGRVGVPQKSQRASDTTPGPTWSPAGDQLRDVVFRVTNQRGATGRLVADYLLSDLWALCGDYQPFAAKLRVDPKKYQGLEWEESLRGGFRRNVEEIWRVTVGEKRNSMVLVSTAEQLSDAPRAQDYNKLPWAARWTLTVFARRPLKQQGAGVSELPLTAGWVDRTPASPFRAALLAAQGKWPYTKELSSFMRGEKAKNYLSDRGALTTVEHRARQHTLSDDGLVCRVNVPNTIEPIPVVPDVVVGKEVPEYMSGEKTAGRSWRDVILAMMHNPVPGEHASDSEMMAKMVGLFYWDSMRKDVEKWYDACRICKSRTKRGRASALLKTIAALKPFAVVIFDMVFVTPHGRRGEIGCLSLICKYTRFPYLRTIFGKLPTDAAQALFTIILDIGIVPLKVLSDRDSSFREKTVLELCGLINSRQGFSQAWHPEAHAPIERVHKEMHTDMGKNIEEVAHLQQEDWPLSVPLVEAKWRSREPAFGVQPFALARGYYGASTAQTVMGALRGIPEGLATTNWMRMIMRSHRALMKEHDEDKEEQRALEEVTGNIHAKVRPRQFREGEHVLLEKGKDHTDGHKMRGVGEGPFKVTTVSSPDSVNLECGFTGRPLIDRLTGRPDRISTARLLKLSGPMQLDLERADELTDLSFLRVGDTIAYVCGNGVYLLDVQEVANEEYVTGRARTVPDSEQQGAGNRRPWVHTNDDPIKVLWKDILGTVALSTEQTLDEASLARLGSLGLDL